MNSFPRLLVIACSLFLFAACGQTSQEKAKESADSSIAELKASAETLDHMGTPRASWSDADFARYEQAINSCERSANKIEELNGKDGVTVYGTWSLPRLRGQLYSARAALESARADKASAAKKESRMSRLQAVMDELKSATAPDETWDQSQLAAHIGLLNRIEVLLSEIESETGVTSQTTKARASISILKSAVERLQLTAKPAA